jgi:hypothetical protein
VHDETNPNPAYAFLLSRMETQPGFPTPIGILHASEEARYEDRMAAQIKNVQAKRGSGKLDDLLRAGDIWEVK